MSIPALPRQPDAHLVRVFPICSVVAIEEAAQRAKYRAFSGSPCRACGGQHPACKAGEGKALQPDLAGATQFGKEEALTAEISGAEIIAVGTIDEALEFLESLPSS